MRTNNDYLNALIDGLKEDGRLVIVNGEIVLDPELWDEYGFGHVDTEFGGRNVKGYYGKIQEFLGSGDDQKIRTAQKIQKKVLINKDLSEKQYGLMFANIQKYWAHGSMELKPIDQDVEGKATNIIFECVNQDGSKVDNCLVAVAGNHTVSGDEKYTDYLKAVNNSLIAYLYYQYRQLQSDERRADIK